MISKFRLIDNILVSTGTLNQIGPNLAINLAILILISIHLRIWTGSLMAGPWTGVYGSGELKK
jgi:hypothetical protein